MHLSALFTTRTDPLPTISERISRDEIREIAHGKSDEQSLAIFAITARIHRQDEAIRRTVNVAVRREMLHENLVEVHAQFQRDLFGLLVGSHWRMM